MAVTTALVLWDVDLTLVDLHRCGTAWYRQALVEITGRDPVSIPPFSGRTDRWIAREMLARSGLAGSDEQIALVHRAVVRAASAQRHRLAELGTALPGAAAALAAVADRGNVTQSVVTGNLRLIAGYKVAAFGLDRHLDLDIGGFGDTTERRADLVAHAVRLAGVKQHTWFPPEAVTVVGDTPLDMHAAQACGVRAIGVASGHFAAADLRAAGAHAVLPNLADTAAAVTAILADGTG